jgi:G:T/U-mismatch repair DNA glycosylase
MTNFALDNTPIRNMKSSHIVTETHPWKPFMPRDARVMLFGTFPPPCRRWSMDFYYPNVINDFWRIVGLIFFGDKNALYDENSRRFEPEKIKAFLTRRHIALGDTAYKVKRLAGNASDKYLEIVEPAPILSYLASMPSCLDIVSTGEKAAGVIAGLTATTVPKVGCSVATRLDDGRSLRIWRMPSTSRAYPLPLVEKARYYADMFADIFQTEVSALGPG